MCNIADTGRAEGSMCRVVIVAKGQMNRNVGQVNTVQGETPRKIQLGNQIQMHKSKKVNNKTKQVIHKQAKAEHCLKKIVDQTYNTLLSTNGIRVFI